MGIELVLQFMLFLWNNLWEMPRRTPDEKLANHMVQAGSKISSLAQDGSRFRKIPQDWFNMVQVFVNAHEIQDGA